MAAAGNRVQNTSNTITWSFGAGDPNPVSIIVTNKDNTTLNGAFSIAESVNVSQAVSSIFFVQFRSVCTACSIC